jgi:hypothetical protein
VEVTRVARKRDGVVFLTTEQPDMQSRCKPVATSDLTVRVSNDLIVSSSN